MNALERRVIDISYKNHLSHIGSCITALPLIERIYSEKGKDEPFVLSNGHAGLALYVVLERHGFGDAEQLFKDHGVHPNTDLKHGIYCSTGSLGHGIGIAVGMALHQRGRQVYCLMSDGECAEGSVWEAIRIANELNLTNLHVSVNANGYSALGEVNMATLSHRLLSFFPCTIYRTNMSEWPKYLQGLQGHYHVLSEMEYASLTG